MLAREFLGRVVETLFLEELVRLLEGSLLNDCLDNVDFG